MDQPPHIDPRPTRYDPDHSVGDMELPPGCCGWSPPKEIAPMPDPTPPKSADPLGRWAPYLRWAVTIAVIIAGFLYPQLKLPLMPTVEQVAAIQADVREIKAAQVQAMKAARQ